MVSHTKKTRNRWYPAETMIDADYTDYLALPTYTPAQAESLLHSLEQAAGNIGFYMNTNKTEFVYFKQEGVISTLIGKPLKFVDQFTYLGSNISSTESNTNTYLANVDYYW